MTRIRQTIAKRMVESLQISRSSPPWSRSTSPGSPGCGTAPSGAFEAREGVKLSFLPFFAKAAVEALKQHPQVNASINDQTMEVTYHGARAPEHRGGLAARPDGAGHPQRRRPQHRRPGPQIADLAERTRNNKIKPDELSGGTFTLTNTGSRGALFDTPILNQPQVGMLGTGAVGEAAGRGGRRGPAATPSPSGPWCTWPCPTTTAWWTARTRPASSRRSSTAWRKAPSRPTSASESPHVWETVRGPASRSARGRPPLSHSPSAHFRYTSFSPLPCT
ncbi:2-oxo acid dehydrogenase subunit E2 [Kutzneria kofuensis]|uniref:2-oxo acid dehydrogenase subunit E2 n=1 Tax=Kutzneria kofuensis TaxID=103725 RepID=UPI0031E79E10